MDSESLYFSLTSFLGLPDDLELPAIIGYRLVTDSVLGVVDSMDTLIKD